MLEKTRQSSGADERTPSRPQYFSWINNTNEGATEEQTLINLDYFKWLHDTYGMEIKIYAWDAGNLDGASGTYGDPASTPKLVKQFPRGYKPCADKAAEIGCHMGIWGGADGFGDTPESEKARYDLIVSLCKDLGFMLFKFDTVCGALREEKRQTFKNMIDECRKYVPDLIVLNHRNHLGDAEICATTFLWGGVETYIDVHIRNKNTASHHRACTLERGLVPEMKRLTEDHGVCLSSYLDYFEDDLIIQAFARSLILAPEIYGNPWLLRDDEQARLARIYNLHAKYNDILVNGMVLPESYGANAVSRGDGMTRLIVLNNTGWDTVSVKLNITDEIGLEKSDKEYVVKTLHPYESYAGTFAYGDTAEVTVEPFRAALILVEEKETFASHDFVLTNCEYETVYGAGAVPAKALIYSGNGEEIRAVGNSTVTADGITGDTTIHPPVYLGTMTECDTPANAEQLYEATAFRADTDSLEAQSRKRSGETKIPEVQRARDAFFAQETYKFRGPESAAMFDGNPDTFFDGESRYYGTRLNGGCLRIDLGAEYAVRRAEITCFAIDEPIHEVPAQQFPASGSVSADLGMWNALTLHEVRTDEENVQAPVVMSSVHNIRYFTGSRKTAVYTTDAEMTRYLRIPEPMDRIYSVRFYDADGSEIKPANPTANNMLSVYLASDKANAKACTVTVPEDAADGSCIAAAINGKHGAEGVYCAAEMDGRPIGFTDRASGYPMNHWEHVVGASESGYTYYLTVTPEMRGREVRINALFREECDVNCEVWLCDSNFKKPIAEVIL